MEAHLIQATLDTIQTDRLEEALRQLEAYASTHTDFQYAAAVSHLLGQLTRIETDHNNSLISYNDYTIKRNKIRSSTLELVEAIKLSKSFVFGSIPEDKEAPDSTAPKREATDMLFIVLLIALLLTGIGLLIYAALSDETLQERVFHGGLSVASISGSTWAYLRIKAIELAA